MAHSWLALCQIPVIQLPVFAWLVWLQQCHNEQLYRCHHIQQPLTEICARLCNYFYRAEGSKFRLSRWHTTCRGNSSSIPSAFHTAHVRTSPRVVSIIFRTSWHSTSVVLEESSLYTAILLFGVSVGMIPGLLHSKLTLSLQSWYLCLLVV